MLTTTSPPTDDPIPKIQWAKLPPPFKTYDELGKHLDTLIENTKLFTGEKGRNYLTGVTNMRADIRIKGGLTNAQMNGGHHGRGLVAILNWCERTLGLAPKPRRPPKKDLIQAPLKTAIPKPAAPLKDLVPVREAAKRTKLPVRVVYAWARAHPMLMPGETAWYVSIEAILAAHKPEA
jgi:hypothetical protein